MFCFKELGFEGFYIMTYHHSLFTASGFCFSKDLLPFCFFYHRHTVRGLTDGT